MARGGRVSTKHQTGNKVQLKKKGRDESDEYYTVCEDDEFDESEDDYCYRIADDETEGSLGESGEEKRTKKVNKVGKPRRQRNGGAKGRKKGIQEEDFGGELRMMTSYSSAKGKAYHHSNEKPRKETNASYQEEGEDSDWNDSDSDEDEDVLPVMKKNKVNRVRVQEDLSAKRKRQKRKLKNLKTTTRKKPKNGCPVKEIKAVAQKTIRGTRNDGGIGKLNASSDSDAAASGFSVYEYTISEEEGEQIREGREICKSLTTDLRSSSFLKMIKEEETVPLQQKRPRTKEKEKMVDIKIEVGKQVCGICLSEEGKTRVRGILNCCSHHFCFSRIMEWSKVESRCPLCKQRFSTISKPAQVVGVGDHSLRDVIIPVPPSVIRFINHLRKSLEAISIHTRMYLALSVIKAGMTPSCFSAISVIHLHTLTVLVLEVKYQKEIGTVLFVDQLSLFPQMLSLFQHPIMEQITTCVMVRRLLSP